jgi:O-antigen/teichoic acid export membrane protein
VKPFDDSGVFRSAAERGRLRSLAIRGAGFTVFGQSLGFVIQMGGTVILARLLTPGDFGLVLMVTTFTLLLANFSLNGFTEAVLQREQIDHGLASNLFWTTVAVGVVLALACAGAGGLLARFYDDGRVAAVARTLAITVFLTNLSVLHLALLKRGMHFRQVSINDIVARAVAVLAAVVLALMGWGYWALVAGAIALPLVTCAGAWTMCRWVPALPRRDSATIPMIRFAMNTYGRFIASYLTWNLDNLLLAWRFGPTPLGLYKKAYDLFILPVNQLSAPLTVVAVSTLSRLTADVDQYRRYYLRALSTLAFIGMGLGACLTLVGRDLILLLLGERWSESGRIFTFFGPGIGIMLLYYTHNWLHLSLGRADRSFRWGIVEIAVTALFFVLGLRWGPIGVAVGWVASLWVLALPGLWYAGRPAQLGVAPIVGVVWKHVVASALAGTAAALVLPGIAMQGLEPIAVAVRILATVAVFSAFYLSLVIVFYSGVGPIGEFAGLLREMISPSREPYVPDAAGVLPSPEGHTVA